MKKISNIFTKLLKRALALALMLCIMASLLPASALAEFGYPTSDEWLESDFSAASGLMAQMASAAYIGPTGGEFLAPIDPPVAGSVAIYDRAGLEAIAYDLNGTYHLVADIDLSGAEWVPIGGNYAIPFTGMFDGQGYSISNLTITGLQSSVFPNNAGLFGTVENSIIKNVGLTGTHIEVDSTSYIYAGGICASIDKTSINNCFSAGYISATTNSNYTISAISLAGGICGWVNNSILSNCYNAGDVSTTTSSTSSFSRAGGICGYVNTNSPDNISTISNCFNSGVISTYAAFTDSLAGGICGYVDSYTSITGSHNKGSVLAFGSSALTSSVRAGGIFGYGNNNINVRDCYNTGDILAATVSSEVLSLAGGIFGSVFDGSSIANCYSIGRFLEGGTWYSSVGGGICGIATNTAISNCYWLNTSAQSGVGSGADTTTPLTSDEMKLESSFPGFDFYDVWDINTLVNDGFPSFAKFPSVATVKTDKSQYGPYEEIEVTIGARVDASCDTWFEEIWTNQNLKLYSNGQPLEILDWSPYEYTDESFTCTVENPTVNATTAKKNETIEVYINGSPTGKAATYVNAPMIPASSITIQHSLPFVTDTPMPTYVMYTTANPTFRAEVGGSDATFKSATWYINGVEQDTGDTFTLDSSAYNNHAEGSAITLTAYPEDYQYTANDGVKQEIRLVISHEAADTLDILPWHKYASGFKGDEITVHFYSPAAGADCEAWVWDYVDGHDDVSDYAKGSAVEHIDGISNDFVSFNTSKSQYIGLSPKTADGTGYEPKYFVYVSYTTEIGEETGDHAYLIVMPQPLRVTFENSGNSVLTDSDGPATINWSDFILLSR